MLLGFIASCSTVLASCKVNNGSKIEDIKNLDTSITWWNNYEEPENKEDFNKTSYSEYVFEKKLSPNSTRFILTSKSTPST